MGDGCRLLADELQPNTKTFTALIGSAGKLGSLEQALEIIQELLSSEAGASSLVDNYSTLMTACEKAGQWDLAVALFDKMSAQVCALCASGSAILATQGPSVP